jgi:hypothetical protein
MAAPRWEVDPSQLPPGLTKQQAVAMLEETDRKTEKERADEEAADQRKAEQVRRAAKKYEERLARAVDKDPQLKALKEKLEAGMKALQNPKLSEKERAERLERMAPDIKGLRSKGLAKAGIDERAMNGEIRRALSDGVKPRGEAPESETEVLQEKDGAFYYASPAEKEIPEESRVTTRGTSSQILRAPWAFTVSITQIGTSGGAVDRSSGDYRAYASAYFAGAGTNRRGVGHYIRVPSGIREMRVRALLPDTNYYNRAYGAIFGGGQSKTYSRLEVWDGTTRLCRYSKLHADVWGLVAAYFTSKGEDNIGLYCRITSPRAGRVYMIKVFSDAIVQAWGSGGAYASVRAHPSAARVELIN